MDLTKLKELAERALALHGVPDIDHFLAIRKFREALEPKAIIELVSEIDRLRGQVDHLINQHMPLEPIPDMPGWTRVIDADRLKAENEALRSALQAVHAEVDGNIRPLTRDLVNMVSGVKNGSHPNDIYDHCDEIDRIIDAALEGGGR